MNVGNYLKAFVVLVLCAFGPSRCSRPRGHFDFVDQNGDYSPNSIISTDDDDCHGDCGQSRDVHEKRHFNQQHPHSRWPTRNFIMTDYLPDGEKEVRIHFDGVAAKETTIVSNRSGLVLRQFSDGHHFVQTILNYDGDLLDCEYVEEDTAVRDFFRNFRKEVRENLAERRRQKDYFYRSRRIMDRENDYTQEPSVVNLRELPVNDEASHGTRWNPPTKRYRRQKHRRQTRSHVSHVSNGVWNITFEELESGLPSKVADWLNLEKTKAHCDNIRQRTSFGYGDDETTPRRGKRSLRELGIMPGTLWCGAGQLAESFNELGPISDADSCCRTHDHCPVRIRRFSHQFGLLNSHPYTISHCACDRRSRRVIRSTMLVPGTKWCGRGSSGIKHNHLGEFTSTDRCCRMHDNGCPFWINSMEAKYGMFNWRPNTLMHCRCDERFRTCLKLADTDMSNVVGRLFFNVVQTKCFVLKPHKVCLERNWKGKCQKHGYAKKAYLRDNMEF